MRKVASKPRKRGAVVSNDGRVIYLDHNATTPLDPVVLEAMMPTLTGGFGNAASITHALGRAAAQAVEQARSQIADILHADAKEIIWTSGATEANNLAIKGVAWELRARGRHIIIQATEHNAVLDPCAWLATEGFEVTILPVNSGGRVEPEHVAASIRRDTILVSVMFANNETGVIQPVREIGAICSARGVLFHTDATQAIGKIPVDVQVNHIDLLSLSAHKFHGPKGCGALYIRQRTPRIRLNPLLHGGGHERSLRSGTLNVPGIVGLGAACELARSRLAADGCQLQSLRDTLEAGIIGQLSGVTVNGDREHRLPHCSSLTFAGVEAEAMLVALPEFALSTGSACTSASIEPSHVLRAMGISEDNAHRTLRFSLGRGNTQRDIDFTISRVVETVDRLRQLGSL